MFRRMRYQQGCLTREVRKIGPDVWVFRWREPGLDGRKRNRKVVVGTMDQIRTESQAMKAVEGLSPKASGPRKLMKTRSGLRSDWAGSGEIASAVEMSRP